MKFPLETIVAWAKRKWFVYPNSEIYGWLANAWDYGPYGSQLRKNIYDLRWKHFVQERNDIVWLDTTIFAHPTTWVASGHVGWFADALIDDKKTGQRFRVDKLIEDRIFWLIVALPTEIGKWIAKAKEYAEEREEALASVQYYIDILKKQNKDWLAADIKKNTYSYGSDMIIKIKNKNEIYKYFMDLLWAVLKDDNYVLNFVNYELWTNFENLSPESRWNQWMHDFIDKFIKRNPSNNKDADWTEVRQFNLMLSTHLGPLADEANKVYMRPETCQSLFTNFRQICDTTRMRVPFGLAQIGKAFRNEITPGQFLYRTREFEQMEIEYFVPADAKTAEEIYHRWKEESMYYWTKIIGIHPDHLRFKDHDKLAHYAAAATDIEYEFPRGFGEVQGIHNRTDFDLRQHQEHSKTSMQYSDPKTGERYIPRCIEASTGLGRQVMVTMLEFYDEEVLTKENSDGSTSTDTRVVVRFPFDLAPVKYAILPLMEKDDAMVAKAEELYHRLRKLHSCEYDAGGNIGKRYRRQDEIGTPYCVCIDHQTLEDNTVTIRDRDTMQQVRVTMEEVGM